MEKTLGVAHPDYGKLLNNVGKLSFQMGDFDAALDFFDRALVNFLENFDENHKEYGYYLNDYAKTLIELGKIEEAILLMKKNLQIAESNEKTNDQAFFNKQYGLASAYISNKDFENALPLLKNATENIKGLIGADHPTYGRMMQSLGECLVGLGSIEEAIPVLEQSNQILISQLDKIFKFRSEDEKKAYLTIVLKNFDYLQSIAMGQSEKKERLTELNLNNQLMLKGLLLNNSKNILLKLNTLNDSEIDNKIISYRSKKNKLIKLLSAASSAEINTITKLKEEINTGETELVKLYNTFFKDDINLLKNWKDAKNKLKQGEVAIEFARFNYVQNNQSKDSILYVAYLYNKKLRTPLMIPLFSEKEMRIVLDKTTPSSLYRTRGSVANTRTNMNAIYNLIWEPLSAYLADVNTVYYAPSGLLFQISFAALGKKNEKLLSEQFELKQLSSTYNLTHEFAEPTLDNALLIGGVNYDYKTSVNKDTNEQHNSLDFKSLKNSSENRNWSDSWNYLPGTLKEITSIQEILNK